jgi:APA family basic amino acid/polyamine antiporter
MKRNSESANAGGQPTLARVLGLGDIMGIIIGSVIGSGIFIVPAAIALEVRSPILILAVWAVGGVLSFLGALCFSELGGMFPHAGGMYVYLREAYGKLPAFLFGWTLFLVIDSGAVATLASAFTTKYLPHFVQLSKAGSIGVMLLFVGALVVVNIVGVRAGANIQNALTIIKLVAIVGVSVVVFAFGKGNPSNFVEPAVEPFSWDLATGFGAALIACLWAYKGWEAATYSTGELKNPQRNLFVGLVASMLAIIGLYMVTNLAYLYVVPAGEIAGSDRIAAQALSLSIGPASASLVSLMILLSILGAANSIILTSPRVYYAMASDGLFFKATAKLHPRFRTPHVSILVSGAWACVLALSGTFEQLAAYVVFGQWLFFGLTVGGVMVLRRLRPNAERPVRVWGYPVTPIVFILASAYIAFSSLVSNPLNALAGLGLIALGVPVYWFWHRRGSASL